MELQTELAVSALGASYHLVFARSPMPAVVYDVNTLRLLAANQAAVARYGYSADEFVALRWPDLHQPEDLALLHGHLELAAQERMGQRLWRHRCRDGALINVELATEDVLSGGAHWRIVVVRDVTQKLVDEQKVRTEHETLAAVINTSNDAVITTDAEGRIQIFNPGAERIFGVSRDSVQGLSIDLLLPEPFRLSEIQPRRRFVDSSDAYRTKGISRLKGLRSDGQEIDVEGTVSQVKVEPDQLPMYILRDVTHRVLDEAEREQSRAQLSSLANKLMLQEKELIKRIAMAMHDHLGQTLATIGMVHEAMSVMQQGYASEELKRLDQQLGKLIKQSIRQVRQVLTDLHPPLLDESGLASALDNELRSRSLTTTRIKVALEVPAKLRTIRWPTAVEYAAFMIAREAVENAFRHSAATLVTVRLGGAPLDLQLDVLDNGVGFAVDDQSTVGHLGLAGMRERAKSIGAELALGSFGPSGSRVSLRWESAP